MGKDQYIKINASSVCICPKSPPSLYQSLDDSWSVVYSSIWAQMEAGALDLTLQNIVLHSH